MREHQELIEPNIVYVDPPDIPEDDLDDIVRRAFAHVGERHRLVQEEFRQARRKKLFEAIQTYDGK